MRRHQAVTELVGVETMGKFRHMPGRMVFDVDLPPGDGTPRGNAGVDPESPGDPAGIRKRRRTGILGGPRLAGNARSNPCPYARSNGRLQETAAIGLVRHSVHSSNERLENIRGESEAFPWVVNFDSGGGPEPPPFRLRLWSCRRCADFRPGR